MSSSAAVHNGPQPQGVLRGKLTLLQGQRVASCQGSRNVVQGLAGWPSFLSQSVSHSEAHARPLLKPILSTFCAHDEHDWLPRQACRPAWPSKAQSSFRAARSPAWAGSRCAWRRRSAGTSTLMCAATCGGTRGALSVRTTLQAPSSSVQPSSRSVTQPCLHEQQAAGTLSDGSVHAVIARTLHFGVSLSGAAQGCHCLAYCMVVPESRSLYHCSASKGWRVWWTQIVGTAILWGGGTAIGEIPPYAFSYHAAKAGHRNDEFDRMFQVGWPGQHCCTGVCSVVCM